MNNKYYKFGYYKFGPFLLGFSQWLINLIFNGSKKFNKVFFFSRDGFMMKKAVDILEKNKKIDSEYVYFSRKSIRQALLYKTSGFEESLKYISHEKYISYGKLLEYYGFNNLESKKICKQKYIDIDEDFKLENIQNNKIAFKLYMDLKDEIYHKSQRQAKLLLQYLKQIKFEGNIAIIDIGWHGSMQYYLEQFIKYNNLKCTITGYYLGTETISSVTGKTFGYIYSNTNLKLKKDLLCCFGLLERLFQSQEGSTFGYKLDGQRIVPILGNYEYNNDEKIVNCINEIQDGAIQFIYKNADKVNLDKEDLVSPLIQVGKNPTNYETRLFKDFYLMDGSKSYFVSQKNLFKYNPKEFIHALSNSPWKTGFMKSVFKIPFPYYKIYDLLKK